MRYHGRYKSYYEYQYWVRELYLFKQAIRFRHTNGKEGQEAFIYYKIDPRPWSYNTNHYKSSKLSRKLGPSKQDIKKTQKIEERLKRCKNHQGRPPRKPAPGAPIWRNDEEE